ncbi:hypothetical protein PHYBLDRAFT_60427 [Phycomyces blakesleeanus NRRL 1555(-)]|uniref:Uncharacterized protein n=1 Tax=Phycomyces blakesleeanus (strain ATCC 8743b / DSM 1359 / FGSC 10004 / NBRC 33097 / NRRL 1555) TaxID=763407 RepID=A0A163E8F0_PHYB8|nr:hypothetical protein PHYBLDRAFT_60427 [Phycomyces blakesleeanus NRRL 1555(-)]OAD77300.1 hypothetical protein PHYBLDRAFT_60427 [Phycomyces blakesleeanus NRRL 1555(-)]|eukprot:XP_018295340.1 hypothetical protein PHYBLDRAFT_60427 [Phycomyces blakesleeanus NRRL 1555(-)]
MPFFLIILLYNIVGHLSLRVTVYKEVDSSKLIVNENFKVFKTLFSCIINKISVCLYASNVAGKNINIFSKPPKSSSHMFSSNQGSDGSYSVSDKRNIMEDMLEVSVPNGPYCAFQNTIGGQGQLYIPLYQLFMFYSFKTQTLYPLFQFLPSLLSSLHISLKILQFVDSLSISFHAFVTHSWLSQRSSAVPLPATMMCSSSEAGPSTLLSVISHNFYSQKPKDI